MRKICIINHKGGVGKTTTAVNIAAGLAREDKHVLIIDLDPQGNIETCLSTDPAKKDMYDFLIEGADINECKTKLGKNLDVIKSRETLTKADILIAGEEGKESILRRKLENVTDYDYIILDCPPSLGLLNQNAMLFATEAIIPVGCDVLGFHALKKMILAVQQMNKVFGHELAVSKIVPTMFDIRNNICKETLNQMRNDYYELITDPIRTNSKLREAPKARKSIFSYAKRSRGAEDYRKLVKTIIRDEAKYDVPDALGTERAKAKILN